MYYIDTDGWMELYLVGGLYKKAKAKLIELISANPSERRTSYHSCPPLFRRVVAVLNYTYRALVIVQPIILKTAA